MSLPNNPFPEELAVGAKYEYLVRKYLKDQGIDCKRGPKRGADIVLPSGRTLEVKSRRRKFTNVKDFGETWFTIDKCKIWNSRENKPLAYIMVSQDTEAMVWTCGNACWHWIKRMKPNNNGGLAECYLCNKSWLHPMEQLVERLRAGQSLLTAQ